MIELLIILMGLVFQVNSPTSINLDAYVLRPTYMTIQDIGSYEYIHKLRKKRRRLKLASIASLDDTYRRCLNLV